MQTRLVIDEDSVYEIDEECDREKKRREPGPGQRKPRRGKGRPGSR